MRIKIGDVVSYNCGETKSTYLGLVVDTTCVQARLKWLNHPMYPNHWAWINIRGLEIVA